VIDKNNKCAEKRKFRTSRAVLDAVLNSDEDSDEANFSHSSDWESSSQCSTDSETRVDDDTQASDTQSDDDQTASVTNSNTTSASDTLFTWSDRATVLHQHPCFIGSPGRKVAIDDITDPLQYFQLFVTNDQLAEIVGETNLQAEVLSAKPIGVRGHSHMNKWFDIYYYGSIIRLTVKMFYATFCTLFHCSDADCVLHIAIRFVGLV